MFYVHDMLITVKDMYVIASVKANIAEKFKIKGLARARFILRILINYGMKCKTHVLVYTESIVKKFGHENAKPCFAPVEAGICLTRADQPQHEGDMAKLRSKR
ncbi:Reverse transcriptase (RNA-dependent DNA polymerase) [Phytophthora infestans]|uniref:Reverse transcriptase (RNA-dependent DNA polymerase) n=1 Tax=Phytophthora infestans TaxID=4787 RepID=A0A8S9TN49_PHYIN|nr:Reverse transcriptase (RNA-dependent DNA polymerase) [Phytophthora infestans]